MILCLLSVVILCSSYLGYLSYVDKQQQLLNEIQKQRTALSDIQQQAQKANQELISQLDKQKLEAENARKQALLDEQALLLLKEQSQASATNTSRLPKINVKAIVLIICDDSFGNPIQSGSGTIITSGGYILTNKHVVTDTNGNDLLCGALMNDGSLSPQLQTKSLYTLSLNSHSPVYLNGYDATVLQITGMIDTETHSNAVLPASFPFIKPASGNLKQGDVLYVFGYPGASDLVFNVTKGIVSSFSADGNFINTDTLIDHGNSGGAAITSDGRFIGIPTQKYVANSDYLGQILDGSRLNLSALY